ncbi:hypothetical protein [Nocardiopsis valliformis]|uniref:hypothetical protein n=1 Tax=Nocardiopsis valliformis TaxID=239974 RepID=UPI00034731F7|nr:hypothetical protein [Nocardiopsis valliformis]
MSTSSEDTSTTAPTDDKPESSEVASTPEADSTPEAFLSGQHTVPRPSLFGAETFSVAGFLMLATTLFATELIAIFSRWVLTPSISESDAPSVVVQGSLTGSAVLAGLAVICAAIALFRAGTTTRAWARQLASATILAGILCVILAVLTFVLMPTPVYPNP